jgi:hypothetical protein
MVAGYDSWLLRQADEYMRDCEPEIIRAEKAYEPDGYSMEYTYNCECCDNTECEHYKEYNNYEE